MKVFSLALAFVLLAAAAPPLRAGQITVPGDYPTLQEAIDAASPDDVILVQTLAQQKPVVVDKPLTILGDPVLEILIGCDLGSCPGCPFPEHAFRLAGPGSGTVVLGNVDAKSFDCFFPAHAVGGGGFDEVYVFDSDFLPDHGQTGLGHGSATIAVDVPYLVVSGSRVRGGTADSDHCSMTLLEGGYPAIDAPTSTVLIADSEIQGGGDAYLCCTSCPCPPSLVGVGGEGGDAVVANAVFVDESTVVGGTGSTYIAFPGPEGLGGVNCGSQPDGVAYVTPTLHQLPASLSGSGPARIGTSWILSFDVPGPVAFLYFADVLVPPVQLGGFGFAVLDPASVTALGPVPTGGPQALGIPIPPTPQLVGTTGAFQILDATLGITSPALAVISP